MVSEVLSWYHSARHPDQEINMEKIGANVENAAIELSSVVKKTLNPSTEINTVERNISPSVEQNSEEITVSASIETSSDEKRPLPPPYSEEGSQAKAATAVTAASTVTVLPGAVVVQPAFSSEPSKTYCKSCHAEIVTNVKFKNTTKTHMFAAGLCFIGGLLCVWIPYYVKSCRNADHYCPNCGAYLGTYVP